MLFRSLTVISALLASTLAIPTAECPLLGPMFPFDFDPLKSTSMQKAISGFPKVIDSLFTLGAINRSHTTFSVDVFSTVTNQSIYQYHHAAPGLNGTLSAGRLDDETIYRIGSVSKLYTAYAILANQGGLDILDHPVTDYLPELGGNDPADPLEKIVYEDVTIGALMAHQGGTGGIPLPAVLCFKNSTCSEHAFLKMMHDQTSPFYPPFGGAAYSDAGYAILGRVLERITGQSYNDALQSILVDPLGLNSSTTIEPADRGLNAVVNAGGNSIGNLTSWGQDIQISAPSGGVYSNNADLRRLGLSIMHSEMLDATQTRQWIKPRAGVSSLAWAIGEPWEINRLALPVTSDSSRTRISDLYTKAGGQIDYAAVFALSPDHGLGYSVLLAGADHTAAPARWPLRAAVGETFVVAAEWAAAENAAENLSGTFVDESAQGNNLTLGVDANHPGLGLHSLYIDDEEYRSVILDPTRQVEEAGIDVSARLYPAGLQTSNSADSNTVAFRAAVQTLPIPPRAAMEGGQGLFDDSCTVWQEVGFYKSAGYGLDEFFLEIVNGRLERVIYPAHGKTMTRA